MAEAVATTEHKHSVELCAECGRLERDGYANGFRSGKLSRPAPELVRLRQAEELRDRIADAHRRAQHSGRFEWCHEPMCVAIEEWLHHETRPVARTATPAGMAGMARMAAG